MIAVPLSMAFFDLFHLFHPSFPLPYLSHTSKTKVQWAIQPTVERVHELADEQRNAVIILGELADASLKLLTSWKATRAALKKHLEDDA